MRVVALVPFEQSAGVKTALDVLASLPAEHFEVTIARVAARNAAPAATPASPTLAAQRTLPLSATLDGDDAKRIARLDPDVLIDLLGDSISTRTLCESRPARAFVAIAERGPSRPSHAVDRVVIAADALRAHLDGLRAATTAGASAVPVAVLDAAAMAACWEDAVRAHQRGARDAARSGYERVLELQPGFAPAHYLLGMLLRDAGDVAAARGHFDAALAAAPRYVDARIAAAKAAQSDGDSAAAVALCTAGLADAPANAGLWRTLGLAQLAAGDAGAAADAFDRALAIVPDDADTHFNRGVALQKQGRDADAEAAYRRAVALRPTLAEANFNLGALYQQRSALDAAATAYAAVLDADRFHVSAYKNLAEVLFAAGRFDAWFANFRRFEAHCPDVLPLMVLALEACHYLADFRKLDAYLDRIAAGRYRVRDDAELVDCLEQLLYLLLFFDIAPEFMLRLARLYDAAARRVYGAPLPARPGRRPGRLRIGYLSADLRNHVMGKMMWEALQYHDKRRFELYFYSLATTEDAWTQRYRSLADRYQVVAGAPERQVAECIAADDLDLLVDLSTHTKGARPGVLAFKPARVLLTHVASAGSVGLSTIAFKLTDRFADIPENRATMIEELLPMDGCAYPFRHVAPAAAEAFDSASLGIGKGAVVIGAFVTGLKLSRRCLGLWQRVLDCVPHAVLAFSPVMEQQRPLYLRLVAAAGIAPNRIAFVPQGRDDAENQARYRFVDFVLDPMPFGGANGTMEALAMGVPVVTLVGDRHGERTSYSILSNLGVTQTIACGADEYVDIACRLAENGAFMREVRAAIAAGLACSPLTDSVAYTRALERAYVTALAARAPEAIALAESTPDAD